MFIALLGVVSTISGLVIGWIGRTKAYKDEVIQEATQDASLHTDVSYIKRGIDDLRVDLRLQNQQLAGVTERLTRVEESSKQAHKRLDKFEERHGGL
ncbi:hypothetical protein P9222_00775 [Paenibacillus amylolyticus]|nr:hypothetical protein [Paenibacillus amylolyticus]WFR63016.1 hypothetical protein P9222_00775 [Paenibacillus amylolyticus]